LTAALSFPKNPLAAATTFLAAGAASKNFLAALTAFLAAFLAGATLHTAAGLGQALSTFFNTFTALAGATSKNFFPFFATTALAFFATFLQEFPPFFAAILLTAFFTAATTGTTVLEASIKLVSGATSLFAVKQIPNRAIDTKKTAIKILVFLFFLRKELLIQFQQHVRL